MPMLAGWLLGLSVIVRYGSAVVVLVALAWLIFQRAWRPLAACVVGGAMSLVLLAGLDWATWGAPLHSFRQYVEFNVISGEAAQRFGSEPGWFFVPLLGWLALWTWPGLGLGIRHRVDSAHLFALSALGYWAAIGFTAHKEARFIYPALVLAAVAAAPAWLAWLKSFSPRIVYGALVASLVASVTPFFLESPFAPERAGMFRLVVKAGREATGMVLINEGVWGSPGYFFLGKNIPWVPVDRAEDAYFVQAMNTPLYNRAVTEEDTVTVIQFSEILEPRR